MKQVKNRNQKNVQKFDNLMNEVKDGRSSSY